MFVNCNCDIIAYVMYDFILENTQSDFLTLTIITVLNQAQRENALKVVFYIQNPRQIDAAEGEKTNNKYTELALYFKEKRKKWRRS